MYASERHLWVAACRNAGQAIVLRGLSSSASGARNFMKTPF
jgi:hypothetical protein